MIINRIMFVIGWLVAIDSTGNLWGKEAGWFTWGAGLMAYAFLCSHQEKRKES